MKNAALVLVVAIFAVGAHVFISGALDQTGMETKRGFFTNLANVRGAASTTTEAAASADVRPVVHHVPLPEQVRAIYMSACVVGTPDFRDKLVQLIEETELNSVMIDVKDFSGSISFNASSTYWQPAWQAADCGARDMQEFIATLHEKGIFVIGRITVFQDPLATRRDPSIAVRRADTGGTWTDYKGLSFVDVGATEYWDQIVELTKLSYNMGFDELNYDYVRYPSDGNMSNARYVRSDLVSSTKADHLERFFMYLDEKVSDPELYADARHVWGEGSGADGSEAPVRTGPYTSADLFGFTTSVSNDLSIGQILERALPHFDFIAPMVYPSHYPDNYLGLGDPNEKVFEVVYHEMTSAERRARATTTDQFSYTHERIGTSTPAVYQKPAYTGDNLRTWIQDFDYGGYYSPQDVRLQIDASYAAGVDSWMIWAPSNIYTKSALVLATTTATTTGSIE